MRSLAPPPRPILFLMLLSALVGASAEVVRAQESAPPTQERVYTREEVGTPAVIVSMPEPVYHNSGEKLLDLTGTVKISVVLSASGRVTDVQLLEGLSQNQNFASLKAARRIRFMPATKDGVPVSQSYVATYGFKVTNQEAGTPDELKGLTRFYIDAGGNREALGEIAAELLKLLPQIVLIDRPEYAECILKFDTYRRTEFAEGPSRRRDGVPLKMDFGRGWVIKPVTADKQRILMYYKGDKSSFVESAPAATFVRAFVYEYKRANDLGK